jgi:hypothetical protein
MRQLLLLAVTAAAVAGAVSLLAQEPAPPARAATPAADVFRADVGDVVHIGAQLICKVERWNRLESLKCVRTGALRGTYGTQISGAKVRVFRFEGERLARTLFTATHNGRSTICGDCP